MNKVPVKVYPRTPPLKEGMRVAVEVAGISFICLITSREGKNLTMYNRERGEVVGVIKYDSELEVV